MGYAHGGPGYCTCWEPIYDMEQERYLGDGTIAMRTVPCSECAFRKWSPERNGEAGYSGTEDELEHIVYKGEPFWCHVGMRRVVKWRHPTGMEIDAHPAAYQPSIVESCDQRFPLKADGSAADICAGWSGKRRKLLATGHSLGEMEDRG